MPEPNPFDAYEQEAHIANLREEALRFISERRKLSAEADKFKWERWLSPWTLLVTFAGVLVTSIGIVAVQILAKHWGLLP